MRNLENDDSWKTDGNTGVKRLIFWHTTIGSHVSKSLCYIKQVYHVKGYADHVSARTQAMQD